MKKVIFLFLLAFCLVFISCTVDEDDPVNGFDDADILDAGNEKEGFPDDDPGQIDSEVQDDVSGAQDDDSAIPDDTQQNNHLLDVSKAFASNTVDTITLKWTNPEMEGFQYVVITHRIDKYPEDKDDGTVIYQGGDETTELQDVQMGETYFFTIYACYGSQGCSKGVNVYSQPCYSQLDVVFNMDVSTTMDFILEELENEIGLVWEFIEGKFNETPRIGLTVFVDDVTVTNDGEPFETQLELKDEFNKWYTHTSTNTQTKDTQPQLYNGDFPENSLDSLASSARDFNWRDPSKTLKIIIHATDDTFHEAPKTLSNGIVIEHTYDETVDVLVQEKIRVAAFAAKLGGPIANKTNVEAGFFTDYKGKSSIPETTGGEVYFIEDVENGTLHVYEAVNEFIENVMCRSYDQK